MLFQYCYTMKRVKSNTLNCFMLQKLNNNGSGMDLLQTNQGSSTHVLCFSNLSKNILSITSLIYVLFFMVHKIKHLKDKWGDLWQKDS